MSKKLLEFAFDSWMKDNKPCFYLIVAIAGIALRILFIASAVSSFFVDWWWKVSLCVVVAFVVFKLLVTFLIDGYIKSFKEEISK